MEDDKAYLRYSFKLFVQRNCHEDEQEDMAGGDRPHSLRRFLSVFKSCSIILAAAGVVKCPKSVESEAEPSTDWDTRLNY